MALDKSVMRGGAFYEGFELIVGTTAGAHVLAMTQTGACAVNSISIVPDAYGPGDTMDLAHMADSTTVKNLLAKNIYNLGAGVPINFDFPALENLEEAGREFRLTYNKVDESTPVTVHVTVEYGGIRRTA